MYAYGIYAEKTLSAPVIHATMRQFVKEMCTRCILLLQNGALWDICFMHCEICEMALHRRCIVACQLDIPQRRIGPSHKPHNATDKYPTMHRFVIEMCTHMHIFVFYKMVHWSMVWFVQQVYLLTCWADTHTRSIPSAPGLHPSASSQPLLLDLHRCTVSVRSGVFRHNQDSVGTRGLYRHHKTSLLA